MKKKEQVLEVRDKRLEELEVKERCARDAYHYWIGRAHPNSTKMGILKSEHHKAMSELVMYREGLGLGRGKVSVLKEVEGIGDFELPPEAVVPYERGYRVRSLRGESRDEAAVEEKFERKE